MSSLYASASMAALRIAFACSSSQLQVAEID
jgi:hypothetical protein